jgi:hypothetical protein
MLKERCSLQTFPGGIDSQVPEGSGRKKERPMMLATLMLGRKTSLKESFPWNQSQVFIFCSWAKVYFYGLARSRDFRKEVLLVGQLTQKVQINTQGLCPRLQPVSLLPRPIY